MSGSMIEIDSNDKGKRTGYLSQPANANGRGIVLLFEVYGLHDDMKKVADIYADNGYTVLVPDLFWKKGEGIVFSYDERKDGGDTFNVMTYGQTKKLCRHAASLGEQFAQAVLNGKVSPVQAEPEYLPDEPTIWERV